ncbi:hypothetical protein OESDEN_20707 [Oesophagostomum dentatum]|uniref:Uncharacterized protein n=1 Tax=Oesophagostomum dentatum TaxID=61180 RepID=A0A0B1S708_OESDE|nr:hypothetical protein OESDEN_20707 [Oesophagostomum dentatum]
MVTTPPEMRKKLIMHQHRRRNRLSIILTNLNDMLHSWLLLSEICPKLRQGRR